MSEARRNLCGLPPRIASAGGYSSEIPRRFRYEMTALFQCRSADDIGLPPRHSLGGKAVVRGPSSLWLENIHAREWTASRDDKGLLPRIGSAGRYSPEIPRRFRYEMAALLQSRSADDKGLPASLFRMTGKGANLNLMSPRIGVPTSAASRNPHMIPFHQESYRSSFPD